MFRGLKWDKWIWEKFSKIRHLQAHVLFLHRQLMQSLFFWQIFVLLHLGHFVPPQSTSVSSWFFRLSSQDTAAAVKELKIFEYEYLLLTNTFVILANIADAVTVSFANLHIFTFWAFYSATVNIRLIAIFFVISTTCI